MQFSFKKYLPKLMRTTRWGELIEVVQSVLMDEIKPNKIDILKTQYDIEHMSDTEIQYLAQTFGKIIPNYDGYTDTSFYFKRQILSLIPRILYKTVKRGYQYASYVYGLIGNIYPIYEDDPNLKVDVNWETNDEHTTSGILYLDNNLPNYQSVYWDASGVIHYVPGDDSGLGDPLFLDDTSFPNLDKMSIIEGYTRHLIYNYQFLYVENNTQFISENTAKALYIDIRNQKRRTEVIYFEPKLNIITQSGLIQTNQWFNNYNASDSGCIKSILTSGNLLSARYISLGNGTIPTLTGGITGVNSLISTYDLTSGCLIYDQTSTLLNVRKEPAQKFKFETYSEVALLDASSGCILYSTFPNINYDTNMYSNWYFSFNINI